MLDGGRSRIEWVPLHTNLNTRPSSVLCDSSDLITGEKNRINHNNINERYQMFILRCSSAQEIDTLMTRSLTGTSNIFPFRQVSFPFCYSSLSATLGKEQYNFNVVSMIGRNSSAPWYDFIMVPIRKPVRFRFSDIKLRFCWHPQFIWQWASFRCMIPITAITTAEKTSAYHIL